MYNTLQQFLSIYLILSILSFRDIQFRNRQTKIMIFHACGCLILILSYFLLSGNIFISGK